MKTGTILVLAGKVLREPIRYEIRSEEPGNVMLWCDEFKLWGSGASLRAALEQLSDTLVTEFQDRATTPDERLGRNATARKHRLLYLFGQEGT